MEESRIETLLNAVINGETIDFNPQSRIEEYLKNCINKTGTEGLPAPQSRMDALLYRLAETITGGGISDSDCVVIDDYPPSSDNTIAAIKNLKISYPNATSISIEAFCDCTSLSSISLPNATSIGRAAFTRCTSLSSISLPNATIIGDHAFGNCTSLSSISLPKVTDICLDAFWDCTSLSSISLPNATSIGYNAFRNCTSLSSISLPNATIIDNNVFADCTSLSSISLPNATSIGSYAFGNCTSLSSISLPNATSIEYDAFFNCESLNILVLSNTETVCNINVSAVINTKIVTMEGAPTGEGFVYVPTIFYEEYVANLTAQATELVGDAAIAEYIVRAILRKIEDYPEICG